MSRSALPGHIVGLPVEMSSASSLRTIHQHERSLVAPRCSFGPEPFHQQPMRSRRQHSKGLTIRSGILFWSCFFVLVAFERSFLKRETNNRENLVTESP